MKTPFLILGIVIVAVLAMGLPYILRNSSAPVPEASPMAPSSQEAIPVIPKAPLIEPAPVTPPPLKAPAPAQPPPKPATQQPTQPTTQTLPTPQAPTPVSVTISGFKFLPQVVTVKKGTKVTWTNNDAVGHTVTGDNGGPASSLLNQGAPYTYTFDTVGTYKYHCSPHPFMTAEVRVTE